MMVYRPIESSVTGVHVALLLKEAHMSPAGEHTLHEISTQDQAWRAAYEATRSHREELLALWRDNRGLPVVFTGCGSTHFLATYAAALFQAMTGAPCRAAPASELYFHTESIAAPGDLPLIVALSRSGETSETLQAVTKLTSSGSDCLTITCQPESRLATLATATIAIPEAQEQSLTQTRSFAAMLVAVQTLAALAANDRQMLDDLGRLPALALGVMGRSEAVAEAVASRTSYHRISFLGSGAMYGLACEGSLKLTEMSLTMADAHTFLEYRHGPMALVDEQHLVVGLISDDMRDYEIEVLREVKRYGGRVLAIANSDRALLDLDEVLAIRANIVPRAQAVLFLPVIQFLGYHRGLSKGLDPDRPRNLVMSVRVAGLEAG